MASNLAITNGYPAASLDVRRQTPNHVLRYHGLMEQKPRLGRSMSVDEVANLLGWSEADKANHLRSLDDRPVPDLEEAEARVAARTE